jgi:hypothetical protein
MMALRQPVGDAWRKHPIPEHSGLPALRTPLRFASVGKFMIGRQSALRQRVSARYACGSSDNEGPDGKS